MWRQRHKQNFINIWLQGRTQLSPWQKAAVIGWEATVWARGGTEQSCWQWSSIFLVVLTLILQHSFSFISTAASQLWSDRSKLCATSATVHLFTSTGPSHNPTWRRSPLWGWSSCPTSSLAVWPATRGQRSWAPEDRLEKTTTDT